MDSDDAPAHDAVPADARPDEAARPATPDPLDAWDKERRRCPVAHDGDGAWTVPRHGGRRL